MIDVGEYISFPKLGWTFPIGSEIVSFPFFNTTITIRWYGVLIALGFILAVIYAFRNIDRFKLKKDPVLDVVLVCTVAAFIGARLYYVFFSSSREVYFANPLSILYVWEGGLGIYGGVIMAFLSAILVCRWRKVDTLRMFDIASIGFLIGQSIGRWGNFFNQEAFGGNTTLPWGMMGSWISNANNPTFGYDHTLPVHPTFLYESLWCALGFVLLHIVSRKAYRFKGQLFSLYIMWYGAGRFFIEQLRTDSLYLFTMKVSCLVAALSIVGGAILYKVFQRRAVVTADADDDTPTLTLQTDASEQKEEELEDGSED